MAAVPGHFSLCPGAPHPARWSERSTIRDTESRIGKVCILTPEEREKAPFGGNMQRRPVYRDMIRHAFADHAHDGKAFQFFCEAQMLWNKSMGWHLQKFLQQNSRNDDRSTGWSGTCHEGGNSGGGLGTGLRVQLSRHSARNCRSFPAAARVLPKRITCCWQGPAGLTDCPPLSLAERMHRARGETGQAAGAAAGKGDAGVFAVAGGLQGEQPLGACGHAAATARAALDVDLGGE